MKASVIFFLLGISVSAVLSNPVNDYDVILQQIAANFKKTIAKIMDPMGINYEDVTEPMTNTLTAFNAMTDAALEGEFDEEALGDMGKYFTETVFAMNNHIGYDADELNAEIKYKLQGSKEAIYATVYGEIIDVYRGLYKDSTGYGKILTLLSESVGVDVSAEVAEIKEYFYRLFTLIHDANSNENSSAESAAEKFAELFREIVTKIWKALDVESGEDIKELVSEAVKGYQGTVAAAGNGKVDEELENETIAAWEKIISVIAKYANINDEKLSTLAQNAVVGFKEAVEGAASRSVSGAAQGVDKAQPAYTEVLRLLAETTGVDVTEQLYESDNLYYLSFTGYSWSIDTSTADASS